MNYNPVIIGKGSYGYIYFPSLICKTNICIYSKQKFHLKNKVSKLLEKPDAWDEMKKYQIIANIDTESKYHLGQLYLSAPSTENFIYVQHQKDTYHFIQNPENYRLIIMNYGGVSLHKYGKKVYTSWDIATDSSELAPFFKQNHEKILKMWYETIRLIQGLHCFIQNRIIHHDIKTSNILFMEKHNRMNYIDFGMLQHMRDIYIQGYNNKYTYAIFYYNMPPELFFYNKERFDTMKSCTDEERKSTFDGFCKKTTTIVDDYDTIDYTMSFMDALDLTKREYNLKVLQQFEDFIQKDDTDNQFSKLLPWSQYKSASLPNIPSHSNHQSHKPTWWGIGMLPDKKKSSNDSSTISTLIEHFREFMMTGHLKYDNYDAFMKASMETFDIYSLGVCLMHLLLQTGRFLEKPIAVQLYNIILRMMDNNLATRISISELTVEYANIFVDCNIK